MFANVIPRGSPVLSQSLQVFQIVFRFFVVRGEMCLWSSCFLVRLWVPDLGSCDTVTWLAESVVNPSRASLSDLDVGKA